MFAISNYLSTASKRLWVLPDPFPLRAAKLAGIEYDSKIFQGGKLEVSDEYSNSRREANIMQPASDFLRKLNDAFFVDFVDEKACRMWILQRLHPEGVICSRCGKGITSKQGIANFYELKRVHCKNCKKSFTALSGTVFNGIKIDLRTLFLLALFIELKIDRDEIARMLKIHPETVRLWEKRFKTFEGTGIISDGTKTNKSV